MKFDNTNMQSSDGDAACQRRWQLVLDFGYPVTGRAQRIARNVEPPARPAFEVLP